MELSKCSPKKEIMALGRLDGIATIHLFLDGNGRVGRLLITFILVHGDILKRPLLYLSYYFKQNRQEYYERLNNVRTRGDWEVWLKINGSPFYESFGYHS